MRTLTTKYAGECKKCAAKIEVGATVVYERRVGIYCPTCAPTDPEEIRAVRQEAADKKADRYEEWADKRRQKAGALHARNEPFRGDIAFNTQPGYIPERARVIARTEKAWEHSSVAARFDGKAHSLRTGVRVAGDAEARRQAARERVLTWLKVGMKVQTGMLGIGTVKKINKKTATIDNCGQSGTACYPVELSWLTPAEGL